MVKITQSNVNKSQQINGAFQILEGGGITLLAGDFFALEARHVKGVCAVYDRAALVALPGDMRTRYVDQLLSMLGPGVPILLLTFEYPAGEIDGPPFCVDEEQVNALFSGRRAITRLESMDRLADEAQLAERGLTRLVEHAFLLTAP